jgi:uncharacterized protein (UPF0335 family)
VQRSDGHPDVHFRNGGYTGPDARLIAAAPDLLAEIERLRAEVAALTAESKQHFDQAMSNGAKLAALRKRAEEADRLLSLACLGLDVEGPQHRTIVRVQRLLLD